MIGEVTDQDFSPRKREALVSAAGILLDEIFDDLAHLAGGGGVSDTNMVGYLPPGFSPRYNDRFARKFLACVCAVASKLAQPGNWPLACVGEELALHALIDHAEALLESAGSDDDLQDFRDQATEDLDCLLLFDMNLDGFEDSEAADRLGMGNLRFDDWFKPFRDSVPVHPYLVD